MLSSTTGDTCQFWSWSLDDSESLKGFHFFGGENNKVWFPNLFKGKRFKESSDISYPNLSSRAEGGSSNLSSVLRGLVGKLMDVWGDTQFPLKRPGLWGDLAKLGSEVGFFGDHIELCTTRPLEDTKNKHNDRSDPRCLMSLMLCR